jgi:hypothetical protein
MEADPQHGFLCLSRVRRTRSTRCHLLFTGCMAMLNVFLRRLKRVLDGTATPVEAAAFE